MFVDVFDSRRLLSCWPCIVLRMLCAILVLCGCLMFSYFVRCCSVGLSVFSSLRFCFSVVFGFVVLFLLVFIRVCWICCLWLLTLFV